MRRVFRPFLPVLATLPLVLAAPLARAADAADGENPEKAVKRYEKAVEKAPDDAESQQNLGIAYLKVQRWADAEATLRKAAQLSPGSAVIHAALGQALEKTGKAKEALDEYKAALAIDPSRLDVQSNLGQAYFDAGQYDDAIEAYKGALKNKPADPSSFYNQLGYAYLKKGDTESALKWFERNVEVAPNSPTTYYNLGQLYRKAAIDNNGDPKLLAKSSDTLVKAAEMDPKNVLGLFFAGEALIMTGKNAEGLAYIDRYLAADPGGKKSAVAFEAANDYKKQLSKAK